MSFDQGLKGFGVDQLGLSETAPPQPDVLPDVRPCDACATGDCDRCDTSTCRGCTHRGQRLRRHGMFTSQPERAPKP